MKNLIYSVAAFFAVLLLSFNVANAQQSGEPIITIHSTAWQNVGEDNQFSIFLGSFSSDYYDIDLGAGLNEVVIEPGSLNSDSGEWEGTWIPARADENGIIKIYGDPLNISIISIDGAYIESIEMSQCLNLEILSLQHNVLQNLDLTPFSNLSAIYLSDNPFTGDTSVVIGPDKPLLAILEFDIIDKIADGFNLSDYPEMLFFDAYYNRGLKSIDTSGCPKLLSLSLEMTDVQHLDVSNNPELRSLNISETRITDIDISNLSNLQLFHASHDSGWINKGYRLNAIDTSCNPQLFYLNLSGNYLGSLDVSRNPLLTNLLISRNALKSIDLSANNQLYSLSLMFNDLDFASLPWPQTSWGEYFYKQNDIQLPRAVPVGKSFDLSKKLIRENSVTDALVWVSPVGKDEYLLDSSLYSYDNGVIAFNTALPDSVYVQFNNSVFYEYPLYTSKFRIKDEAEVGLPSSIAAIDMAVPADGHLRFSVGIGGASPSNPESFFVEFAPGNRVEFESLFSDSPSACNVDIPVPDGFNGHFEIYIPENSVLSSLSLAGCDLISIDLSASTELRYLDLNGCGLKEIDLRCNRCLEYLDVSNNNLSTLDLKGIAGNYEKNTLYSVKAAHNNLKNYSDFIFNSSATFRYLDLSYNCLENFKLTDFENLDYVDLSHNLLSEEMYLTYQISASHIDISNNLIPSVVIDDFDNLQCLNLTRNRLSLATLPLPSEVNADSYLYAPQLDYQLSLKTPRVDLSSQNRVVNGVGTSFVWYKLDGDKLIENVDYVCSDGVTRFLNAGVGEIYCAMSNPAFPDFEGNLIYRTTNTTPAVVPDQLVASFVTLKNDNTGDVTFTASRDTELYIDWRGDGSELVAYPVSTSYISYPAQVTYAGAEVKIYSYESADLITVFSVTGIPMQTGDFSALSSLFCLNLSGSGLSEENVSLPLSAPISEFSMSHCKLASFPWSQCYPDLKYLVLSNNRLSDFDASVFPNLSNLYLNGNNINNVSFDNPFIWNLNLANNQLENIDVTALPMLEQADFSGNLLADIDLSPVKSSLRTLSLASNRFCFSSLPLQTDFPNLFLYYYGAQAALDAVCVDGCVDLSSSAFAGNVPSEFTWLSDATYDSANLCWSGNPLVEGDDYVINDGVTVFLRTFSSPVMAVISNSEFPNLVLYTDKITVDSVGAVDDISADPDKVVSVFNLQGFPLRVNVKARDALSDLPPAVYIVDGKKTLVR